MLLSSQNDVTKTSVSVTETSATTAAMPAMRGPLREWNTPCSLKTHGALAPPEFRARSRAQQGVERGGGVDHAVGLLDDQRVGRLVADQGLVLDAKRRERRWVAAVALGLGEHDQRGVEIVGERSQFGPPDPRGRVLEERLERERPVGQAA